MNVGQILETHLGWAAAQLGFRAQTPVFQGATEDEIGALLKLGGAVWAGRFLAPEQATPTIDADLIQAFVRAIQKFEGNFQPKKSGLPAGLGRSLDAYLRSGADRAARAFLQDFGKYVLEVARIASGASTAAKLKQAGWPAAAGLVGQKTIKDGLDAAVVELMLAAGIKPGGKMSLRDGRTGDLHDEALPPGGRQDPRALDRAVQPGHAAAAGR